MSSNSLLGKYAVFLGVILRLTLAVFLLLKNCLISTFSLLIVIVFSTVVFCLLLFRIHFLRYVLFLMKGGTMLGNSSLCTSVSGTSSSTMNLNCSFFLLGYLHTFLHVGPSFYTFLLFLTLSPAGLSR